MLYYDSRLVSAIHKMRQDEVSKTAERARLRRDIELTRPGFLYHFLTRVGGLLILFGKRLQRRYRPVASCAVETCQPDYQLAR